MRERRYHSVVALRKEDYERLGVNGTQEGADVSLGAHAGAKHKRLMAFVNDLLFLVVAEVTLNYIRRERRDAAARSKIIYSPYAAITRDIVPLLLCLYPSLFPNPRKSGKDGRR